MRVTVFSLFAAIMAAAFGAQNPTKGRLDVSAEPATAKIVVDGVARGVAKASVFELEPGVHRVRIEAPSHETVDDFVKIGEGELFVQKTYSLEAQKALILLKSEPAGAEVKLNGSTLGNTPLLLTTLDSGRKYAFDLALNGYRSKKIEVEVEGRRPMERTEALVLDSGIVECTSEPAGAEVMVNGVSRGFTPVTVERVPKGVATFKITKAGYRDETRELRLTPGERQTLSVTLRGKPAKLTVVSVPEQGRVFLDGNYQGKAPVTFEAADGEHEVRVEQPGFAPLVRKVMLAKGAENTEEFRMENVLGRLEIVTTPAGARVFVDGKSAGLTKAKQGSARSAILSVEKVDAGMRTVTAKLDGYLETSRKVKVQAKETCSVHIALRRLFVPDTEVETVQGTIRRGVLIEKGIDGIHLETSPGVEETIPLASVRNVRTIEKK